MLAPNIVTRCWRKKSTNLWPSGVAPWKPDCRTGFLSQFSFPLFGFHHISEAWVAIWFKWEKSGLFRNQLWQFSAQNCSWVLGSSASNCTGKTISWKKDSKYFLFRISLTNWAVHDVSADFPLWSHFGFSAPQPEPTSIHLTIDLAQEAKSFRMPLA